MARRKTLTDTMVVKLKPGPKRLTIPDPELRGHYVRVTPTGGKSYVAVAREPYEKRKQVWATIGSTDLLTIDEARDKARAAIKRIKAGKTPFEPAPTKPDSFKEVAEKYLELHVRENGIRTEAEIKRILDKYIYPALGDHEFIGINRTDITKILDAVHADNGPRQSGTVLTVLSAIMNWQAARIDDYVPPIVRGMGPKARKRKRTLDDDEIRTVWKIAEGNGTFGGILRLALLTAQRRGKLATMKWGDVDVDGVWNMPELEDREKGHGKALVLPEIALDIIRAQKRIGDNPNVFAAARGDGPFSGWSQCKRRFDDKVTTALRKESGDDETAPLPHWTLHDLRRTARSLMARAKVRPDIAERVMGHDQPGVEGVYDRHTYRDEKADALKRLTALIETILNPPTGNVVEMKRND